ncbi:MAG: RusA family crossover junction endodeoxyribonuclease [Gloeomargarita sp. SKYB31]|nr:RusA family crossover junction endodeoxyribonuclease [Gloeomargarita sp. SKYB31]
MPTRQFKFTLSDFHPKPRPRVTAKGTYLPPGYRRWKTVATSELGGQILGYGPEYFPISQAHIHIELRGATQSDPDNAAGAILDALVAAGVLADDRLRNIPHLSVTHTQPDGHRKAIVLVYPR